MAFGYCHRLRLCVCRCVCQSVCQSLACPHDNSGPVQSRIAKFGPKMQKTLVKVPIVLGGNWHWPSRSNLTWNQNLPHFELVRTITHYPFNLGSLNLDHRWKIAWLRSLLFWMAIDLDLQEQIWFKKLNFLVSPLLEIHNHHITTAEPWVHRLLHRPDCFMVSILCAYLYTRLFYSPDCFTISTHCTHSDLGSRLPSLLLTSVTLTFDLWPWPFAWTSLGHC